jgi:hypothetical protein
MNHRDTEKASGMFATLIIVLPSLCTGGTILVRHRHREARLDLSCPEPSQVAFAAFYADCVHEVLPITSGYRLTLVYNLRRQGRGQLPTPPNYDTEQAHVTALLRQWSAGKDTPDDDSPAAAVLVAAAAAADCDLHLALVSIKESGSAEYLGSYGSRRRWGTDEEDEEDFEVSEVHDRYETLSDWRRPDCSQPALGDLPFMEDELCPSDAFADLEPDVDPNFGIIPTPTKNGVYTDERDRGIFRDHDLSPRWAAAYEMCYSLLGIAVWR